MRWVYFLLILSFGLVSFGDSSLTVSEKIIYNCLSLREQGVSFYLLATTKTNVLFSFQYTNDDINFYLGDNYVYFGNGLVLGDPKYRYFMNYLFSQKFVSNGVYGYNFYQNDRNFDGVSDIPKGIYIDKKFGYASIVPFLFLNDIQNLSRLGYGVFFDYNLLGVLLLFDDNLYLSGTIKKIDFLNLGMVFSGETATCISTSNYQVGFGTSGVIEWYTGKFEFSLSFNFMTENFYSPYSSSFYSVSNRNGVIFSMMYSDGNNMKFYGVNKLLIYGTNTENGFLENEFLENEFSFSVIKKLVKNVFSDFKLSREQGYIFFSVYPYFDNGVVNFYIKPQIAFCDGFYDGGEVSYTLESGSQINFWGFEVGAKVFTPFSDNVDYFIFVSTVIKDNLGENEDTKIPLNDTSFLVFARFMPNESKKLGLPFDGNFEVNFLISLKNLPSYKAIFNIKF